MYHARISSEDYRRVLDAMAEHDDEWVARKTIIAESGVSEANVSNALLALKAKEVILQDKPEGGTIVFRQPHLQLGLTQRKPHGPRAMLWEQAIKAGLHRVK
jgi:hypothetical protein